MNNKAFCKKVRIKQSDDLADLLENICQENNISNYFGTISVAVGHALDMLTDRMSKDEEKFILFKFEQCVGGVVISIECDKGVFNRLLVTQKQIEELSDTDAYIVSTLADNLRVFSDGRGVELAFLISGIEPELLSSRREIINQYFRNKVLKTEY